MSWLDDRIERSDRGLERAQERHDAAPDIAEGDVEECNVCFARRVKAKAYNFLEDHDWPTAQIDLALEGYESAIIEARDDEAVVRCEEHAEGRGRMLVGRPASTLYR